MAHIIFYILCWKCLFLCWDFLLFSCFTCVYSCLLKHLYDRWFKCLCQIILVFLLSLYLQLLIIFFIQVDFFLVLSNWFLNIFKTWVFWILCYSTVKLTYTFWFSWLLQLPLWHRRWKLLPHYWQMGIEVHVPHSASVDTHVGTGLLIIAG